MNMFSVKEVSEVSRSKFSECDLGKAAEQSKGALSELVESNNYDRPLAVEKSEIKNRSREYDRMESEPQLDTPLDVTETIKDTAWKKINDAIDSKEGIGNLVEKHPEKTTWQDGLKAKDVLNDPDATDAEKRSAQAKLSTMKGDMLETMVKDVLSGEGFTVEEKQRLVEGQDGGTRPDIIAKNDTDRPISVFGIMVKPGETLSIECKCGSTGYLRNELKQHIPNQLSGQLGHRVLLSTADIRQVDPALVRNTCKQYGASLVVLDTKVSTIEKAIKEVSAS